MIWKAIGQSVIGTSHTASGKPCEDAVRHACFKDEHGDEVLVCCVADGAGSALHAQWTSEFVTGRVTEFIHHHLIHRDDLTESLIYAMAEDIYDELHHKAKVNNTELNEYSCTMLGCIITSNRSAFFQVGDGAIVRNDGTEFYTPIWWPHNGEYQNTTSFLVDDTSFANLNVMVIDEQVNEVAIFSDGLQMLALSMDSQTAHQPFFADLFRFLRKANGNEQVTSLDHQLATYLDSPGINHRTDDDKTLFLATRLQS